jgi:tRNA1(Val) A37 N6-methylase TrmN6
MTEPPSGRIDAPGDAEVSRDSWLGGRLTLMQPRRGHRIGTDAALLAAAAECAGGRLVDVGAGVGAVGLALLARGERSFADLVEIEPALARLAAENAAENGLGARTRIVQADLFDAKARRAAGLADEAADLVVTNPPFFDSRLVRVSPDPGRAKAHAFDGETGAAPLAAWLRASLALLRPGGRFVMIHRPDALPDILAGVASRLGGLALMPVHPRLGAPASRILVAGVKGSKAPLRIAAALILHDAGGGLTEEADAIHRGERRIDWGGL